MRPVWQPLFFSSFFFLERPLLLRQVRGLAKLAKLISGPEVGGPNRFRDPGLGNKPSERDGGLEAHAVPDRDEDGLDGRAGLMTRIGHNTGL